MSSRFESTFAKIADNASAGRKQDRAIAAVRRLPLKSWMKAAVIRFLREKR